MRSTQDPIQGLKRQILEWEVFSEEELRAIDREVKQHVEAEVKEAEACPPPDNTAKNLFEDIYVPGSEPAWLRGRTVEGMYLSDTVLRANANIVFPQKPTTTTRCFL